MRALPVSACRTRQRATIGRSFPRCITSIEARQRCGTVANAAHAREHGFPILGGILKKCFAAGVTCVTLWLYGGSSPNRRAGYWPFTKINQACATGSEGSQVDHSSSRIFPLRISQDFSLPIQPSSSRRAVSAWAFGVGCRNGKTAAKKARANSGVLPTPCPAFGSTASVHSAVRRRRFTAYAVEAHLAELQVVFADEEDARHAAGCSGARCV